MAVWLACNLFLEIALVCDVVCVCMCICVSVGTCVLVHTGFISGFWSRGLK